jgi:HK97 family phage major capsid protein
MSTAVAADDLRNQLLEAGDRMRELREKAPEERAADWQADIRETRDQIYALDAELQVAEAHERRVARGGPVAGTAELSEVEYRSVGQIFVDSEEIGEWATRGAHGISPAVMVERRALISSVVADGGALLPKGDPFIAPGAYSRRRLFVRDIIAGGSTTLSSVPYVRELNPRAAEGGASAVPEASAKPEVTMQFEPADAPARTIAAWVPITRQAMEDMPTLRSYIDGRLGYMVALREEDEILNGPGTGARLLGILNTPGVQTQAAGADKAITIGLAIAKVELVDGEADGVVINPTDYWTMMTTRSANQFDGGFGDMGNLPFGSPPQTLWGLPAIRSRGVTTGQAVVGAWRMGAQLFDRSSVEIRVSDQHEDRFVKNQLVILAEERVALAVHRPDFFVKATLP